MVLKLLLSAVLVASSLALRPNRDEITGPTPSQTEALVQSASMPRDLGFAKTTENTSIPYNLDTAYLLVHKVLGIKGTWQDPDAWKGLHSDVKLIFSSSVESRMEGLVDLLGEISTIVAAMYRDLEWLEYYCQWRMADDAKREMIAIVEKYLRWDDIDNDEQGKLVKAIVRLSIRGEKDRQNLVQYFVYKCYKFPLFGQHFAAYYNDPRKQAPLPGSTIEDVPDPKAFGAKIFRLARSFDATAFTELLQASVPVIERVLGEGDERVFVPDFILSAQETLLSLPTPESVKARMLGFKRKRVIR